jgi:hypothetical protein
VQLTFLVHGLQQRCACCGLLRRGSPASATSRCQPALQRHGWHMTGTCDAHHAPPYSEPRSDWPAHQACKAGAFKPKKKRQGWAMHATARGRLAACRKSGGMVRITPLPEQCHRIGTLTLTMVVCRAAMTGLIQATQLLLLVYTHPAKVIENKEEWVHQAKRPTRCSKDDHNCSSQHLPISAHQETCTWTGPRLLDVRGTRTALLCWSKCQTYTSHLAISSWGTCRIIYTEEEFCTAELLT